MPVRPEQLRGVLAKGLAPVYLVSGDDTLLVTEACDQIIAAARAQGYTERSVHHVDIGHEFVVEREVHALDRWASHDALYHLGGERLQLL